MGITEFPGIDKLLWGLFHHNLIYFLKKLPDRASAHLITVTDRYINRQMNQEYL